MAPRSPGQEQCHPLIFPRSHLQPPGTPRNSEQSGGDTHLLPLCHDWLPQPCQRHVLHPVAGDGTTGCSPADLQMVEAPLWDLQVGGASVAWPICGVAKGLLALQCMKQRGDLAGAAQMCARWDGIARRSFWGGWMLRMHSLAPSTDSSCGPQGGGWGPIPSRRRVPPTLVHTLRVISGTSVSSSLKSPT